MRRRADRERQAAEQRHAAIEAHQLHRDLALVVVHRQHRVECAALGAQEHGVGRKRPLDRDALRSGARATAGAMMSISSRPKLPPSPACGLSAGDRDARPSKPALRMQASVSFERTMDAFTGQCCSDVLEAGYARSRAHSRSCPAR